MVLKISENHQIQTPVGQLAKTMNYQPKTAQKVSATQILVDFSVGRQAPKISHALTHTRERKYKTFINNNLEPFKLYKDEELHFLETVPKIFTEIEKLSVVFHSTDYVDSIYSHYKPLDAHLFLEWVKTFAMIRAENRAEVLENVILTTDNDFLLALRFFKAMQRKPFKEKKQLNRDIILEIIEKQFSNQSFGSTDVQKHCFMLTDSINYIFRELKELGKIQSVRKLCSVKQYRLISQTTL